MPEPAYRAHRLAGTATHRIHSIQCLNSAGVVIALAATNDGEDYGLAICAKGADADDWIPRRLYRIAEPTVRDINDVGQFVGWSLKSGREHALVGRTSLLANELQADVWRSLSGATAIDAKGRFVGFHRSTGQLRAFLHDGSDILDLDAPSSAGSFGYYANSISQNGTIIGALFDASGSVLIWESTGRLVDRIEVDFGRPIGRAENGHILCEYGVIIQNEHVWFAYASRCTDFVANDANSSGEAVGFGRATDRNLRTHACLWRGGESFNLNDLVEPTSIHLREATAINDDGWIACTDGVGDPLVLQPIARRP